MADFALVQAALRTSTGTQDFTVSGFGTPKAAMIFVTSAITNGTTASHAILGIGATDGTRSNSCCGHSKDNVATSLAGHQATTNRLITVLDQDAGDLIIATFTSWVTDGMRITVAVPAPAVGYLITVLLIGGTGVSNAYVSTVTTPGVIDTATTVSAPGFQPDLVMTYDIADTPWSDTNGSNNGIGIGFVQRGASNPHAQYSMEFNDLSLVSPTQSRALSSSTQVMKSAGGSLQAVEIRDFTSNGFSAFTRDAAAATVIGYVALKFSGISAKVVTYDTPTSGGSNAISGAGFTPQFGMLLQSSLTARDSQATDVTAEAFGIGLITAAAQYSVAITSDDNVATSNAESVTHSRPVFLRKDSATFMDATFTSFNGDGVTLNYGTSDGTTRKWAALFIQDSTATTPAGTDSLPVGSSDAIRPVTVTLSIAESG